MQPSVLLIAQINHNMPLSRIIFFVSLIIWLLPPLKQFRGKFFFYFLLQAISDPVVMLLFQLKLYNLPFYLIKDFIIIFLLWKPEIVKRKLVYFAPIFIPVFYLTSMIHYTITCLLIACFHIAIIYLILKMFMTDIWDTKNIKYFYIFLLLYEFSVSLKFIQTVIYPDIGILYYYITTAFGLLFGLLFAFVRDDNSKLAINIKR